MDRESGRTWAADESSRIPGPPGAEESNALPGVRNGSWYEKVSVAKTVKTYKGKDLENKKDVSIF